MKFPALGHAALIAALLATTAPLAAQEMTDAERSAFRAEVRAYLVENPEVLIEAMTALEAKQQADQANNDLALLRDNAEEIFNDPASWAGGNLEGDITLVEFVDYRCGYCRKAHDEVAELVKSDGNIRFVLKEYPILGE
ncbi:MAG: thioredoxin domain-containing protein, partial [Cereibacter changlensis]